MQNNERDTLEMLGATISVKWKDNEKNEARCGVERASTGLGSGPLKDTTVVHA